MTRFARAKGSKSSNERAPEDSTPWEVMKEQLLQAKKEKEQSQKREEAENQRLQNYQNFIKDQKVQKKKASWCDFPETSSTQESNGKSPKKKKKKNKSGVEEIQNQKVSEHLSTNEAKKKNNNKPSQNDSKISEKEDKAIHEGEDISVKKGKKKKKNTPNDDVAEIPAEDKVIPLNNKKNKNKSKGSEGSNKTTQSNNNHFENSEIMDINNETHSNQQNKKKQKKKKPTKFVDGKPVRRKEIDDRSFQLIINGKEVDLVRFDGFPIMRKDAERLDELKKNMIKKGIPKSEVQRTMKLERRRAEKALARLKREVCYNCRKGGHNLSDCPDLKSKIPGVDAAEGVCFKCGSTEHKQFECKVQKDKEFKFATCFICKEPGHIARQCPDNPKGLYPNGGSCKLCGDVTHLRKDCPTVQDKREESSIKLQTLDNNVEDIGIQMNTKATGDTIKKPKKIKF